MTMNTIARWLIGVLAACLVTSAAAQQPSAPSDREVDDLFHPAVGDVVAAASDFVEEFEGGVGVFLEVIAGSAWMGVPLLLGFELVRFERLHEPDSPTAYAAT